VKTRACRAICAVAAFGLAAWGRGEGEKAPPDAETCQKIAEWQRAALNRELAAAAQLRQHDAGLLKAKDLRAKKYATEKDRRANFGKAGDLERAAGEVAGVAVINFERAATNWLQVAREYARAGEQKTEAEAKALAGLARDSSRRALQNAAQAYEMAAEAFSEGNADEPGRAAFASERAAAWREKLASRRSGMPVNL
jgi:hypothetical protein